MNISQFKPFNTCIVYDEKREIYTMKSFLKQNFIRRLLILSIALVFLIVLFLIATTIKTKAFRIDDTIENVFMGDSHVRYAVNDSLIKLGLNLANSSESTYFSYFKLKRLLQLNPNIKTVYLGFSYHNISAYYDQYTYGRYSVAPNYFFLLNITEQLKVMKWSFKRLFPFLLNTLKFGTKNWMNKNTFQGGFDNPFTNVSASETTMNERLDFQYYSDGMLYSFSHLNLTYFNNIITLCNKKNVKLIILNTPLHNYYLTKVPAKFVNKYDSLITSKGIEVMDLSQTELADHFFQPDGDLVSREGAKETTKNIIHNKQYLENNPQQ